MKYKIENLVDSVVLLGIFLFFLSFFNINLLVLDTTMTGGDVASMNYFIRNLRDKLLPSGQLIGWDPGWYGGFPNFQFYFPLAFHMMIVLSFVTSFNIAIKVGTALTVILLPYATYISFKLMRYEFPTPPIAAIMTLFLIFTENYGILGGNILSMLAGMPAYAFGLVFVMLFIGSFPTGMRENKRLIANSLLLAACGLSSQFTGLFAALITLTYLPSKKFVTTASNVMYALKCGILGFLLTAWWSLPLIHKHEWAAVSSLARHDTLERLVDFFPWDLTPIFLVGLVGVISATRKRDERVWYTLLPLVCSIGLIICLSRIPIIENYTYNGRYVSMFYLFSLCASAYGFAVIAKRVGIGDIFPILVFLASTYYISTHTATTQAWINNSYMGYESKIGWPAYKELMGSINALPGKGRVMFEHSGGTYESLFGTSRAFEDVPYFTNKPGLEGTVFESSLSSVFVVSIIQAELSEKPSCPLRGVKCPQMNMADAKIHSKIFNVKYVILSSTNAHDMAKEAGLMLVKSVPVGVNGDIGLYEMPNHEGRYITVPENYPVVVYTKKWHDIALRWFRNTSYAETPLILTKEQFLADKLGYTRVSEGYTALPIKPINAECNVTEEVFDSEVRFRTDCVGLPHIIKVSYFPNWMAEGALGPYLVSPSLMLVVPTENNVRVFYGVLPVDRIGSALTILGIILVLGCIIFNERVTALKAPKAVIRISSVLDGWTSKKSRVVIRFISRFGDARGRRRGRFGHSRD